MNADIVTDLDDRDDENQDHEGYERGGQEQITATPRPCVHGVLVVRVTHRTSGATPASFSPSRAAKRAKR